jgi:putative spermidine/putrescine transport system permease protein
MSRLDTMPVSPLAQQTRGCLGLLVGATLTFLYLPIAFLILFSFETSENPGFPITGLTLHWFPEALKNTDARDAFVTSLKVGAAATAVALFLGTLASLAVARHRFFGRETVSFLVILPIALPGIVTGVALSDTFTQVLGVPLSLLTVIIAHATFCIVVVYNNVVARLRRSSMSIDEASADLGADPWQTFRYVTLPTMSTALAAGALLAFALSFDEIIVTLFTIGPGEQTLPIWIFENLFRPNQIPIVNVVAVIVVLLSIIPVYLAHRLTREDEGVSGRAGSVVTEATATP